MAKRRVCHLEHLECRHLMASFQMPWPEIDALSLSFVPDGTAVGNDTSGLYSTLHRVFPNDDIWQREVLRAFQTWAVESNINIALVEDGGQPIGTLGFKQGDVRFGDVRIGAFPMASDVLAVANPYDPFIANTWVGDVFLNSEASFLQESADPAAALYSLMLHESGHVFGIEHSADANSPMFPEFRNDDQGLTVADIANLRRLYGTRQVDAWEGPTGNQDVAHASPVSFYNEYGDLVSPTWSADLSSANDVDTYSFQVPANQHAVEIHLNAAGISLLTAQLTVRNAQGEVIATQVATDPRDNNLTISLANLTPGEQLTFSVSAAAPNVFGVGAYELQLVSRVQSDAPAPPEDYATIDESAPGPNVQVLATTPGYVEHTYYEAYASLTAAHASQTYSVRSVDLGPDITNVFTVIVGTDNLPIDQLNVSIKDAQGNLLPYSIIPNSQGELALQVRGVASNQDYSIEISAKNPLVTEAYYSLEVDFAQDGAHLETFVNETLSDSQPSVERTLHVVESQQFHFVLGASDFNQPQESGLTMQIADASGKVWLVMQAADGTVRTGDVFLNRGDYTVSFTSPHRVANSPVIFQLSGLTTSAPIGPQLRDTLHEPVNSASASPSEQLSFYWSPGRITTTPLILASSANSQTNNNSERRVETISNSSVRIRELPYLNSERFANKYRGSEDSYLAPKRDYAHPSPFKPQPTPKAKNDASPKSNDESSPADTSVSLESNAILQEATEPSLDATPMPVSSAAYFASQTLTRAELIDFESLEPLNRTELTTDSAFTQAMQWLDDCDPKVLLLAAATFYGSVHFFIKRRRHDSSQPHQRAHQIEMIEH